MALTTEARDCKAIRLDAFFDSKERKYFITPQKRRIGDRGGQIERRKRKPSARFRKAPKSMQFERWKARARKNRNGCPRQFSSSLPTRKQSESVFW